MLHVAAFSATQLSPYGGASGRSIATTTTFSRAALPMTRPQDLHSHDYVRIYTFLYSYMYVCVQVCLLVNLRTKQLLRLLSADAL